MHLSTRTKPQLVALAGLILFLGPFLLLGNQASHIIFDSLDSHLGWYASMDQSNQLFHFAMTEKVPGMLGGQVERFSLPSPLHLTTVLFDLFEPFTAFQINFLLTHLLAFFGMWLLLRRHILKDDSMALPAVLVALAYTALPFFSLHGGGEVAGLPLVLYALLNLGKGENRPVSFLVLLAWPLFGSLVLTGVFVLGLLWLFMILKTLFFRSGHLGDLWLATIGMTLSFAAVDYMLIYQTLFHEGYVSHRSEFSNFLYSMDLPGAIRRMASMFVKGHYHAPSHHWLILALAMIAVAATLVRQIRFDRALFGILALLGFFAFIHGLWFWSAFHDLREGVSLLKMFNGSRIVFLSSPLWYLVFAMLLLLVVRQTRLGTGAVTLLAAVQLILVAATNVEYRASLTTLAGGEGYDDKNIETLSVQPYARFFADPLFREIDEVIGRPKSEYAIGSVGIVPAIAQANGFRTIGGYNTNYPLAYKHAFRSVIASEIDKSDFLKNYFDGWGNKVFLFSDDMQTQGLFFVTREAGIVTISPDWDMQAFRKLGGEYLVSSVTLDNAQRLGLELIHTTANPDYPWDLRLYGFATAGGDGQQTVTKQAGTGTR